MNQLLLFTFVLSLIFNQMLVAFLVQKRLFCFTHSVFLNCCSVTISVTISATYAVTTLMCL